MNTRYLLPVIFIVAASGSAVAEERCAMTYAQFEFAVPHLDVDVCPAEQAGDGVFCRASVGMDAVHVYAFSREGDQCLLSMRSLAEGEYRLSFD